MSWLNGMLDINSAFIFKQSLYGGLPFLSSEKNVPIHVQGMNSKDLISPYIIMHPQKYDFSMGVSPLNSIHFQVPNSAQVLLPRRFM